MVVITTFGYPGAGKGTLCDIADSLDYHTLTMGDVVRERAQRAYSLTGSPADNFDQLDNDIVGQYADDMRHIHGDDVMARLTLAQLSELDDSTPVVIDGLRGVSELELIKDSVQQPVEAIFIEADQSDRLRWLRERGRDGTESRMTLEQLKERDAREAGWGLQRLVVQEHYDYKISNDSTYDEFKTNARDLLQTFQ